MFQDFGRYDVVPSKMVFGNNLHYMAPFGIPRPGCAWFFSAHVLLFVHALGRIVEPRMRFLDFGSTCWAGNLVGGKEMVPNKTHT